MGNLTENLLPTRQSYRHDLFHCARSIGNEQARTCKNPATNHLYILEQGWDHYSFQISVLIFPFKEKSHSEAVVSPLNWIPFFHWTTVLLYFLFIPQFINPCLVFHWTQRLIWSLHNFLGHQMKDGRRIGYHW